MERYFGHEHDITPIPESARDILNRTDLTKIDLHDALKQYISALRKIEAETVGQDNDQRIIVEATTLRAALDAQESFKTILAAIRKDMAKLMKDYNAFDLQETRDYLQVLLLEDFIQQRVDEFNAATIPINVDML